MTLYQILIFNRELIKRLESVGFRQADFRYLDLYKEYTEMKLGGVKKTWLVAVLADKYKLSERKVYELIKYFEKDCTDAAV